MRIQVKNCTRVNSHVLHWLSSGDDEHGHICVTRNDPSVHIEPGTNIFMATIPWQKKSICGIIIAVQVESHQHLIHTVNTSGTGRGCGPRTAHKSGIPNNWHSWLSFRVDRHGHALPANPILYIQNPAPSTNNALVILDIYGIIVTIQGK